MGREAAPRGVNGIWRFRHAFGLPENAPPVSLGEGDTPLVWAEAFGLQVAFKLEYLNPTGSFKDRGSATLISFLCSRGATAAVEDSSGNAGASFAAYAARAGLKARVFLPESASGPKRKQIEAYGAEVNPVPGPRSNAAEAVRQAASQDAVYASHAFLPFNLPGYATAAYELVEQLGQAPGTIVCPAGQGGLLLGMSRGFAELQTAGAIPAVPVFIGVQARACAPFWAVSSYGAEGLAWVTEGETLAEGVRVRYPLRGDAVLQAVESSGGRFIAVDEEDILPGRDQISRRGFYVEATSAIVWSALSQITGEAAEPVVAILTGSGLKASIQ
jgi:threonine synthase